MSFITAVIKECHTLHIIFAYIQLLTCKFLIKRHPYLKRDAGHTKLLSGKFPPDWDYTWDYTLIICIRGMLWDSRIKYNVIHFMNASYSERYDYIFMCDN